ncbi:protein PIN-LIKES 3-like isoform X1 [Macadamia integrifolia]|uniref:protein PIN-LIKES 3-like isoform X1 n=1 Tax=Macadamia integrifolia TaxID=60698 RepID=UPI001C4F0B82|nr:protein PIN-LIKES 3-like isoform X1 [Macadamia integrifolia]XP_042493589.1 protein PIN-LIKES 3-like isoform X1 [Macadamia integrifolia]XP_042493590.1 protein PIN-LIKES 3-like isoform X1 [Macadamia integrifolia]XP_042493591.1 protein PIN-LIKES 3-like isoform X1 [Macadamia integrifolia]
MGLLNLFIVASNPVLKVLLVTALGSFLALDSIGILGDDARKNLNRVVFFVFNPALVSSNLAKTITYESMRKLWFMPINILFTFLIGSALGWILIQITRPPSHLRGLILGCCAAGNLGNLLIIIVPAICKEKGSPFGDSDVCSTYGLAYASLSMAIGALFLWSYVYNVVRISSSNCTEAIDESTSNSSEEPSAVLNGSCKEPLLSNDLSILENQGDHFALPCSSSLKFASTLTQGESCQFPISVKFKQYLKTILGKINLKTLFAPSTTGAIVGFFVGVISPIRWLMIGDSAPLRVVEDSAYLIGEGAIPATTLIMGANLLRGLRGSDIRVSLVVGIIAVRYIALPLFGILIVKGALHFGLVQSDPLYTFVLLLQFALPPAMNIGTITQLFGAGERECSVILLWTYGIASIALTLWSTFFMWLVA